MKIAILLPGYFEEKMGGAELQAKYLAQTAIEKGHLIYYIFLSTGKEFPNQLAIKLFPIIKLNIFSKLSNIKYFYIANILKTLKLIEPDIIYSRTGTALAGSGALYARKNGIRSIFHVAHDRDVEKFPHPWFRPYIFPEHRLMQYGIRNADIVITQTQFQAIRIKKNYQKLSKIIPNAHPIPVDCIKPTNVINIIWIANWKKIKQPEIFINLAKKLSAIENIFFKMIGRPGNYSKGIMKAIEAGVEVVGELPNEKVNEFLTQSHLLVNTSRQEGFSNTFIQAWMRKVPVVSLQVDPDSVLEKEGIGFCSGSFDQLVKDTKKLITDDNLRNEMGERARAYAIKNHSLTNMDKILDLMTA